MGDYNTLIDALVYLLTCPLELVKTAITMPLFRVRHTDWVTAPNEPTVGSSYIHALLGAWDYLISYGGEAPSIPATRYNQHGAVAHYRLTKLTVHTH